MSDRAAHPFVDVVQRGWTVADVMAAADEWRELEVRCDYMRRAFAGLDRALAMPAASPRDATLDRFLFDVTEGFSLGDRIRAVGFWKDLDAHLEEVTR